MSSPENPFPVIRIGLGDVAKAIGSALIRVVHFLPEEPLASHGDHLPSDTGAEAMLGGQGTFGWDSEGTYINQDGLAN